ncbi:MAG: SpoIID/LytB domain-containing protein, partial [Actinomycetota bacterium]
MRLITGALASALFLAVLPAHPGQAANKKVIIKGGGWGHGIGMSQYGAYGRASNGATAPDILEHYYSNTNVTTANMPRSLRVGLLQGRSSISLTSEAAGDGSGGVTFKVTGDPDTVASGGPGTSWRVKASGTGGVRIYKNGHKVKRRGRTVFGTPDRPLQLRYEASDARIDVTDKSYDYVHGHMEFVTYSTNSCSEGYCMSLVVELSMQKYLYGLGEVPASWPGAALRAQAIAGRTYAFDKVQRSGQHRYPCDCAVYDSTIDQAYIGDAKRTGSAQYWDDWKAAVDDTKATVILYQGDPIQALYSSSSGGHTEHNENVWGGTPLPYLRGVGDAADDNGANPNHKWQVEMTWASFESKLNAAYGTGELESFEIVKPLGVSGRVTVVKDNGGGGVRIAGSKKTARVSGWSVRSALGLKDTLFTVEVENEVGEQFKQRYRRLDRAPGRATSSV